MAKTYRNQAANRDYRVRRAATIRQQDTRDLRELAVTVKA